MNDEEDFYIVMKLTSGEDVMCSLLAEDEEYIEVMDPIKIGTIMDATAEREVITAKPLCQFTNERTFVLQKKNIIYIKPLAHSFTEHYIGLASKYLEMVKPEESRESIVEEPEDNFSESFFIEGTDTYN